MARTALLCVLPAVLIATGWRQLESPARGQEIALVVVLGIAVALLPRRRLQLAGAVGASLIAVGVAFGLSPLDARPLDGDRDYFGPLLSQFWHGTLDYYEVSIPFDPSEHERMHGVLLLAAFGFTLAAALAIARRRPVLAAALTFAGAAWPVTLVGAAPSTGRGALLLVAALILLAAVRPAAGDGARQAALVGGAVFLAAVVAVSSPAVAKGGFLDWEQWRPYDRQHAPVSVSYVWDADYTGISLPKRPTTVLTIKAKRRVPYWRATTLDSFIDDRWIQDAVAIDPLNDGDRDVLYDPLLPPEAVEEENWQEQEVTVRALRDTHLIGATVPVAFERQAEVTYYPGIADVGGLSRDQTYKVWSYIRQPTPRQLIRSRPNYPDQIHTGQFLGTGFGSVPPFGTPGRGAAMRQLFSDEDARVYEPLYDTALEVVGRPRNPYAAVVALEAWFRTGADFRYDEHPPVDRTRPPLVAFIEDHRRGYCQHFAGAMALMLRYLGVPARVGAGFTSGRYDADDGRWTVSDTNAHTWVEVWFDGYGWLPFDPTPGRGRLGGSYTSSSFFFDVSGATGAFAGGATALGLEILRSRLEGVNQSNDDRFRGLSAEGGADGEGAASGSNDGGGDSLIGLLLLIAVALTAGLWAVKFGRRSLRYLTRDPRRLAAAVRLELVDYLVDQRVPVSTSATPAELGTELEQKIGVVGDRLALALAEARYGPAEEAPAAAEYARRELRSVRRRIRRRLGTWARLRGLLSLRSLGLGSA